MTSAFYDYKYAVQVKGRFDLLSNEDYNNEDPDHLIRKMRAQKHETKATDVETPDERAVAENPTGGDQRESTQDVRGKPDRGRVAFSRSRPAPSGGQRQFDRHSGSDKTGVKAVIKKGGHGTGNWGTIEDELEAQLTETNEEETIVETEAAVEQNPDTKADEAEEAPKTITLKEYKEQLKASKANVQLSTKGTRRPNDGKNVFSSMVEVHKSKPTETKVADVLEEEKSISQEKTPMFFEFNHSGHSNRGRGTRTSGPGETRGRGTQNRFMAREQKLSDSKEGDSMEQAEHVSEKTESRGGRGEHRGSVSRGRGEFRGGPGRGRGGFERGREFRGAFGRGRGEFRSGAERGRGGFERGRGGFDRGRGEISGGEFNRSGERGRGHFHEGGERGRGHFHEGGEKGRGEIHAGGERGRGEFRGRVGGRGGGRGRGAPRGSFNGETRDQSGVSSGDRTSFRGNRGTRGTLRGAFRSVNDHDERRPDVTAPKAPVMDSEAEFPALK